MKIENMKKTDRLQAIKVVAERIKLQKSLEANRC